jgi:membrane protein
VSTDKGSGSAVANATGGSESTPATGTEATTRRRLADLEHRLIHEEQRLVKGVTHAHERMRASTAGRLWSRLNAVDFMNSSMQFAALGILTLFPLLVVVFARVGDDGRLALVQRLGLDQRAANDVKALMSSGQHAAATLSVVGGVIIVLGGIGLASTLQTWYQKVYEFPPPTRWIRQLTDRFLWLAGFIIYLGLQEYIGRELGHAGARVPVYVVTFVIAVAFFWWTVHVLLCGRMSWRQTFPAGLATGICATGLSVFSALLFSSQIVSGQRDYGPIGVVTVLLSWLIGWAVCLHLGAVLGRMWNERHLLTSSDQPHELLAERSPGSHEES